MNPYARLQPFDRESGALNVVIDTPKGSRNKYSWDEKLELFSLTGVLPAGAVFPYDFGFIPNTRGGDGDPLDVLVVLAEPTFPGCVVRARPIGVLDMADEKGHDFKILAVAADDPRWDAMSRLADLSPHRLLEIETFFRTYKTLERRETDVRGWLDVEDAWAIIDAAMAAGSRPSDVAPGTWR